jgi:hypothetical protein
MKREKKRTRSKGEQQRTGRGEKLGKNGVDDCAGGEVFLPAAVFFFFKEQKEQKNANKVMRGDDTKMLRAVNVFGWPARETLAAAVKFGGKKTCAQGTALPRVALLHIEMERLRNV